MYMGTTFDYVMMMMMMKMMMMWRRRRRMMKIMMMMITRVRTMMMMMMAVHGVLPKCFLWGGGVYGSPLPGALPLIVLSI